MAGSIDNEDYEVIDISKGIYASHPSLIPDGYAKELDNFIIRNGIVESRYPFINKTKPLGGNTGYLGYTGPVKMTRTSLTSGTVGQLAAIGIKYGGVSDSILVAINVSGNTYRKNLTTYSYTDRGWTTYNSTLYAASSPGKPKCP